MQIWKYPFRVPGDFELEMPIDSKVLSIDIQYGIPCMWCLVYPNLKKEKRKFLCVGTGIDFEFSPDRHNFLGTIQLNGFVWHIWE